MTDPVRCSVFSLYVLLGAALPSSAADLSCSNLPAGAKSVSVITAQPVRRGKSWVPGKPQAVFRTVCGEGGIKSEESEYSRDSLVRRTKYLLKPPAEAKQLCLNRRTEAANSFAEESMAGLDEFCREQKKKNFDAVQVFDLSQDPSGGKPVRTIFRIYDKAGLVAEEYEFAEGTGLETRTVYEYAPDKAVVSKTEYAPDGAQISKEVYSGSETEGVKTISYLDANDQLRKKTKKNYRADGALILETSGSFETGGQQMSKNEIYYDPKGAPERELVYRDDLSKPSEEYRYSHKFDPAGNWIERRKTKAVIYSGRRIEDPKSPPQITIRQISYK